MKRIHFGTDRKFPARTLCGVGRPSISIGGRSNWKHIYVAHDRQSVDCPKCQRKLKQLDNA